MALKTTQAVFYKFGFYPVIPVIRKNNRLSLILVMCQFVIPVSCLSGFISVTVKKVSCTDDVSK